MPTAAVHDQSSSVLRASATSVVGAVRTRIGPPMSTWPPLEARARRKVDPIGNVSFAGTAYNVGRGWTGQVVDVFTSDGVLCVAIDDTLVRRHDVRHDVSPA